MNQLKPVILCIDDEEANLKLLEKLLVPRGYIVVSAASGEEALLEITNQTIDLVLLDIIMPGMDGFEVCRQIKEDPKLRNIPVIMITASIIKQDRILGIEAGAEEFLSKPFDQAEVLARIKMLLKMKKLDDERKHAESQREAALAALQKSHDELERRVRERTAELAKTNEMLQADITKRKQIEKTLKKSEENFRHSLEDSPLGTCIVTVKGETIYANKVILDIYGYANVEELNKIPLKERYTPQSYAEFQIRKKAREDGDSGPSEYEINIVRKNGEIRHLQVLSKDVLWNGIKKFQVIYQDITDRKRMEVELQQILDSLKKAVSANIQIMVSAVEMRDPYTAGHQIRSANLACVVATEMGLPQDKIDGLRMASSIHDIGKLSIPAEILSKPTKLTDIEFPLIKEHSHSGYEMLKNVESPWPLAQIVYQHHERMNGSGYPRNLKGNEILIEARIMAVADVVESMASHRPYRPALGVDAAMDEIESNRGILYDIDVVNECLRLFREKGYQLEGT